MPVGELGQPRSRKGLGFLPGTLREALFPCTQEYFSRDACWGHRAVETSLNYGETFHRVLRLELNSLLWFSLLPALEMAS